MLFITFNDLIIKYINNIYVYILTWLEINNLYFLNISIIA